MNPIPLIPLDPRRGNREDDRPTALVVEASEPRRDEVGEWLEAAGFDVVACPGPSAPEYTCVGSRTGTCSLAHSADVVVLDLWLAGDTIARGTPGWELLLLYSSMGKPVVALADEDDPVRPVQDPLVAVIRRPPSQDALLQAVGSVLAAGRAG